MRFPPVFFFQFLFTQCWKIASLTFYSPFLCKRATLWAALCQVSWEEADREVQSLTTLYQHIASTAHYHFLSALIQNKFERTSLIKKRRSVFNLLCLIYSHLTNAPSRLGVSEAVRRLCLSRAGLNLDQSVRNLTKTYCGEDAV